MQSSRTIVAFLATCLTFGAVPRSFADHTDVPLLEESILLAQGMCSVDKETLPCELYVGRDGSRYIAVWFDDKVGIVKRLNADGTQDNVYDSDEPISCEACI